MSNYSENDWRNYSESELEHSWGTSAEQKAKERAYNHRYWAENRERIMRQRRGQAMDVPDSGTGNAAGPFL